MILKKIVLVNIKKSMDKAQNLRIVFLGTPDFAVFCLKALVENHFNIVGVVTNPDKKSGRGQKWLPSPVSKYAEQIGLRLLKPTHFKSSKFLQKLKSYRAELQIVIAFKVLPAEVWDMPPLGTINLHPSYLPEYRGAAPIHWAIINGEKKTGVTIILLQKSVDAGHILIREKVDISETETAGELQKRMEIQGIRVLMKTINAIVEKRLNPIPQPKFLKVGMVLKKAPKISKHDCQINWSENLDTIYNHIRGLCPTPTAWTLLQCKGSKYLTFKIYDTTKIIQQHKQVPGTIVSDNKNFIHIAVKGGFINVESMQIEGKKRLRAKEFLNGIDVSQYKILSL